MDFMIERIGYFCSDNTSTLVQLGLSSEATIKLLQEAAGLENELSGVKGKLAEQRERVHEPESEDRKELIKEKFKVVQACVYFAMATGCFGALKVWAKVETWAALCVGMIAVLLLFLNGKITEGMVRWLGGTVSLNGASKGRNDKASKER